MRMLKILGVALFATAAFALGGSSAWSQSKNVKIIVPYPPAQRTRHPVAPDGRADRQAARRRPS